MLESLSNKVVGLQARKFIKKGLQQHIYFFRTNKIFKGVRNRILRTILVWSLFCLIRLYVGLHFLRFLLEN